MEKKKINGNRIEGFENDSDAINLQVNLQVNLQASLKMYLKWVF